VAGFQARTVLFLEIEQPVTWEEDHKSDPRRPRFYAWEPLSVRAGTTSTSMYTDGSGTPGTGRDGSTYGWREEDLSGTVPLLRGVGEEYGPSASGSSLGLVLTLRREGKKYSRPRYVSRRRREEEEYSRPR